MEGGETCPLPADPALAAMAVALRDAGHWAEIVDRQWRYVYATDDFRLSFGGLRAMVPVPLGAHYFGPEALAVRLQWPEGPNTVEYLRNNLASVGGWTLADTPGGADELRALIAPELADIVDRLPAPEAGPALTILWQGTQLGRKGIAVITALRVRDADGRLAGTALVCKPSASMTMLGMVAVGGDLGHFERMQRVANAARRPAAILFADLEGSSPLARRLSTASYFAIGRRMVRAVDQCVVDAGGLVGRHVGDGVVAFFLAETAGSESAAARACIEAARATREAMAGVATRSGLSPDELAMRFGLHWGATLYVGQIATSGRAEVTALGDEVNECARIEACATGGRALASKELLERLDRDDAVALSLDPAGAIYSPLAELATATEKARRDAPAIAVSEV